MKPTRQHVAERAGVSTTTVSYVMNGRSDVSIPKHTRMKVMKAANDLGYRPSRTAQALVTGMSHVIALWLPLLNSTYFSEITHLMHERMAADEYDLVVTEYVHQRPHIGGMLGDIADGLMTWGRPTWSDHSAELFTRFSSRIVSFGIVPIDDVHCVWIDLGPASREAVQSLVEDGRKRIAFFTTALNSELQEIRNSSYRNVLAEAGLPARLEDFEFRTRRDAYEAAKAILVPDNRPDAMFCTNDELAITTLRAARDIGLSVPEDLAIIGCDGIEDALYQERSISTIIQPVERMCDLAWSLMKKRLEDPNGPVEQMKLQAQFVRRQSS